MRPGESGGQLQRIKGSQDIVLFKEEGDIYCLKKRKTERHKRNREKQRHIYTRHETKHKREKRWRRGRSEVAGVGVVSPYSDRKGMTQSLNTFNFSRH